MRAITRSLTWILGAVLFVPCGVNHICWAVAQAPTNNAAPKPPQSSSQVLLDSWNDVGRKLIAMAEDLPETSTTLSRLQRSAPSPNNCSMRPAATTSSLTRLKD